jgi:hypothetical protein
MEKASEGRCFGEHRFFVCETFIDEKTRIVDVVLACTACGEPKVLQVSLNKKDK